MLVSTPYAVRPFPALSRIAESLDNDPSAERVIRIGPELEPQLLGFRCRRYKQPWTEPPEFMIRQHVVGELLADRAEAIGVLHGQKLVAVLAWSEVGDPPVWESNVLATAEGSARRGHAERLKRVLLELAADVGVSTVRSVVHVNNTPIITLNKKLGAEFTRDPTNRNYLICEIHVSANFG
jgi:RimJ/RimL family protein N-acetyltransferase